MKRKALCVVGMMLLAGCGQRGDLYFPEAEREAVITVPAQLPAPQSTAEDETDETATLPAPAQPGGAQPGATGNAPGGVGQ